MEASPTHTLARTQTHTSHLQAKTDTQKFRTISRSSFVFKGWMRAPPASRLTWPHPEQRRPALLIPQTRTVAATSESRHSLQPAAPLPMHALLTSHPAWPSYVPFTPPTLYIYPTPQHVPHTSPSRQRPSQRPSHRGDQGEEEK